jgi:preprotein translocase subunit SecA
MLDIEELEKMASEKITEAFAEKIAREEGKIAELEAKGIRTKGSPTHGVLRHLMVRKIDQLWQEHLLMMDHLRADVNLRAVGQRDPLTEFKHEAFAMFDELSHRLRAEIGQDLFRFEIIPPAIQDLEKMMSQLQLERNRSLVSEMEQAPPQALAIGQGEAEEEQEPGFAPSEAAEKLAPITVTPKIGRNDDCPCGSGKKYKKCCGALKEEEKASS